MTAPSQPAAFTADDHRHMARALQLAARGLYSTPPNPSVGCVLVAPDGEAMVGEGFHARAGEPHAEVFALREAGASARGATAYVSLEPCSHFGRTPPCADALLEAGVARVIVAMRDPNPQVNGGGLGRLSAAGVATAAGLLEAEARELNRGFVSRMSRGRPWVTVKIGASLDGRTALANGASQWITGAEARADVQRLRARASAILTGIGTALADDPSLTVRDDRLETRGRRPLRVVLDSGLQLPPASNLAATGTADTLVLASPGAPEERAAALESRGVRVRRVAAGGSGLDLAAALACLAELECNEVLVEAGAALAGAFVAAGLSDEIVAYTAPTVLGDEARPMLKLPLLERMSGRPEFDWHDVRRVGRDLRLTLRPRPPEKI
jgi:diaminohydroxyphosphoribosylaminopyrimidine deaminase/5-amino-6-(5-phosphoribosylamino)uracil reductase